MKIADPVSVITSNSHLLQQWDYIMCIMSFIKSGFRDWMGYTAYTVVLQDQN